MSPTQKDKPLQVWHDSPIIEITTPQVLLYHCDTSTLVIYSYTTNLQLEATVVSGYNHQTKIGLSYYRIGIGL